ncbi:MAG: hypothetical protein CVV03_04350 [Firmicutes bacterium HGW-Firmicutes-8]|nr:MAG: hypothetical protein CVV03_04350 [Firmicutes bacterium HGW-Firmicutes-8]
MFTDRRPTGLKIIVTLTILNSLATLVHFILMERGILNSPGLTEDIWIYGVAVTLVAVLPVTFGSYGLYYKRIWGLSFFTLGGGAYLYAAAQMLLLSVRNQSFNIMFFISIYLILFNLFALFYCWTFRHHFRDF